MGIYCGLALYWAEDEMMNKADVVLVLMKLTVQWEREIINM